MTERLKWFYGGAILTWMTVFTVTALIGSCAHAEIVVKSLPPGPDAAPSFEREIIGYTTNADGTQSLIAVACGSIITVTMTKEELLDESKIPEIQKKFGQAVAKACNTTWAKDEK
jgi:hypothetical protein